MADYYYCLSQPMTSRVTVRESAKMKFIAALAAFATMAISALSGAGVAGADGESYLDYLRGHGTWVLPQTEQDWIVSGNSFCTRLREGMPRGEVLSKIRPFVGRDPAVVLDGAQHELCPDTL